MNQIVLCFGDSNTYGYRPVIGGRYDREKRFTGILQSALGADWTVVEEGLNGRTANEVDNEEPFLNGRDYAEACVMSHRPVYWLVCMLGTNDVKVKYGKTTEQIAQSITMLVQDMKHLLDISQGEQARVLLIAPKALTELSDDGVMYDAESRIKSEQLGALLCESAKKEEWGFLDANEFVEELGGDGVHLTEKGHQALAKEIYAYITNKL